MTELNLRPELLEGYSVLTNDNEPSLKAVAFVFAGKKVAFPVNKELAGDLAKMFQKLADELPENPQVN